MIIIDSNQLVIAACHRCQTGLPNGKYTVDDVRSMFLNEVLDIKKKVKSKGEEMVFAFDFRGKNWRHAYFPHYKAKRADARADSPLDWDVVHACINTISEEMDKLTPFTTLTIRGCEADDIIGVLALREVERLKSVTILSSDKDFIALQMYEGVRQWSYYKDGWISVDDPKRFLTELIIKGDTSDSIPNATSEDNAIVAKIRQKPITAKRLDAWIPLLESGEMPEDLPHFTRNKKLIDLHEIPMKVKQLVLDEYQKQLGKDKSTLYTYIAKSAPSLFTRLEEFTR